MTKVCRTCNVELIQENWFPSSQKTNNYECKSCQSKRSKANRVKRGGEWLEYRKNYAKKRRRENRCYNLRSNYGITADEWDSMFKEQGNACKICGTKEEPSTSWHTDHCHDTGKIRGILCHKCNVGLGNFDDDKERIMEAFKYLSDLL